ncbi:12470_t:CDS:2 [Dentiscutata erythropus]|uniref:12470_t:CDS:1 n=1 Tax=Dentiscutata erythropus TaxID=1348616 RepID=A0A9N9B5T0_9GLOM|nr:12470_t:CDS:2 [Dentiscutata erythropus]
MNAWYLRKLVVEILQAKKLSDLQKQTIQAVEKKTELLNAANANIPSM